MTAKMAQFQVGDDVQKATGAYKALGEIRSVYTTRKGDIRYVVQVWPQGFQMIWSDKELVPFSGGISWPS